MKKILLILAAFFLLSFADKLWTEMRGWYKYNRIAFFSRQPSGSADSLGVYSQVQVDSIAGTLGGTIDPTPTNGSSNAVQSDGVFDALALKSPLTSPTFTGTPLAPTATAGTSNTQVATTAYVDAAVTAGAGAGTLVIVNDANYTIAAGVGTVIYSVNSVSRTITLPAASSFTNRIIHLRNAIASGSDVLLSTGVILTGTATTTSSISAHNTITIQSDGTSWWVVSKSDL